MGTIEELIKEQKETKLEIIKDRYIRIGLYHAYADDYGHDFSIYECFRNHRLILEKILADHCWEPAADGFVTRTNFRYDQDSNEIIFDTHKITKEGDKYVPDLTRPAIEKIVSQKKDFIALAEADKAIAKLYSRYQTRVDDGLERVIEFFRNFPPYQVEPQIEYAKNHNQLFFDSYGQVGISLLIRWLNKLSNPFSNTTNLLEEFTKEVNGTKSYLEVKEDPNYLRSKSNHLEFEDVLLRVIERYSPKGEYLSSSYRKSLEQQTKKKTV